MSSDGNSDAADAELDVEDNRGNRIELCDEQGTASMSEPGLEDHPYQNLTPDTVIEAVESTGRISDARILALYIYDIIFYQVGLEQLPQ